MKNNFRVGLLAVLVAFIALSCNKSKYYPDPEDSRVAIFSDKGYNVMSCIVNGQGWRTSARKVGYPNNGYEVHISIFQMNTSSDSLVISWTGGADGGATSVNRDIIALWLAIPRGAGFNYVNGLQGQRLNIDPAVNGFYSFGTIAPTAVRGGGTIFFKAVNIDSTTNNNFATGKIAGLFTADLPGIKIENGRFDHQ